MSSRNTAIIIGGAVGAAVGATLAWAYSKAQESKTAPLPAAGQGAALNAGAPEYIRIGLALLTLMRQIADLFKPT